MFKTLKDALKVKEIRNGLIFTFFVLIVVRLGSLIPAPGIDTTKLDLVSGGLGETASEILNTLTGGSITRMSIFALSVTPYITSSIIMQLLTIAIPALEEMQKDGDEGRKKITAITRVVSVALAIVESLGLTIGFGRSGLLKEYNAFNVIVVVLTLTVGSALVMWLGERVTERGVGNGISIILLINIVSRIPSDMKSLWEMFVSGKDVVHMSFAIIIIVGVILITTVLTVILNDAERRIPVTYAQKTAGRNRMTGGRSSHIPLKVNTGNVMPIIFASTLMSIPSVITSLFNIKVESTVGNRILEGLNSNYWFKSGYPWAYIGLGIYILLVIFFAYFYTSISFNPMEISQNLKKGGGFIPGIRPGKPTQDYLNAILNYIVIIGAFGLMLVALIPIFFNGRFGANVSFGGTSLIIIVGVIIETIKQIESKMVVRNYSGFLNA